jgi:hypothetical protein
MTYLERLKELMRQDGQTITDPADAIDETASILEPVTPPTTAKTERQPPAAVRIYRYRLHSHPSQAFTLLAPCTITEAARILGRKHGPANILTLEQRQRPHKRP